jgi:hypothetical protein
MAEDARSPVLDAIEADLESTGFKVGVTRGLWRLVEADFPFYVIAVMQQKPDGQSTEYCFRFELDGYPTKAPKVQIWDFAKGQELETSLRPNRTQKQREAFKAWQDRTVYRPWERCSGAHNNWNATYSQFAWNPSRNLTYALNDLYQILIRGGR